MATGPNRILDEFAKLVTDAAGAAQGVRREVETAFRSQAEEILNTMDVVQREEFEAVRDMAMKARAEEQDARRPHRCAGGEARRTEPVQAAKPASCGQSPRSKKIIR